MAVKVIGSSVAVTTANNVNNARIVRAYASANTLVTVSTSADVTIGTFVMPGNTVEVIAKANTDKITANVSLQCTPIANIGY